MNIHMKHSQEHSHPTPNTHPHTHIPHSHSHSSSFSDWAEYVGFPEGCIGLKGNLTCKKQLESHHATDRRRNKQWRPHCLRKRCGMKSQSGTHKIRPNALVRDVSRKLLHCSASHVLVSSMYGGSKGEAGDPGKEESTRNMQWSMSNCARSAGHQRSWTGHPDIFPGIRNVLIVHARRY